MTNEELDEATAEEAERLWKEGAVADHSPSVIAARLARENWTPPKPVVDPDVLAFREWKAELYQDLVLRREVLAGKWDHPQSDAFLAGARMAREQEQERAAEMVGYLDADATRKGVEGALAREVLARYRGGA